MSKKRNLAEIVNEFQEKATKQMRLERTEPLPKKRAVTLEEDVAYSAERPKKHPKQDSSEVLNMYKYLPTSLTKELPNPNIHLHGFKTPFRMLINAPSGSGKTNFLLNLIRLFCSGEGTFESIQIVTRNKDEPLYKWLEAKCPEIKVTEGLQSLPQLDRFDKTKNHLVAVDDFVLAKDLRTVCNYYVRARKLGVSIIFLSQGFYITPKIIRQNCNYVVFLKLSGDREVKMILSEFGLGVSKEQLLEMYRYATEEKLQPLVIHTEADDGQKFRKGFLELLDENEIETGDELFNEIKDAKKRERA